MELGPIFRTLIHNRTRTVLIAFEVALTLAIVVNCLNMIRDMRGKMLRPTGLDVESILVVHTQPFDPAFEEEAFVDDTRVADLRALRAFPGVRAATAIAQIPLSGGGSSTGRKATGSTTETIGAPYFVVADDALETLGVELAGGRGFVPDDFVQRESRADEPELGNVILTQALADALFPDGNAVGRTIQDERGESINTVVGIVRQMHNSWPESSLAERVMLIPGAPGSSRRIRYMVRAQPGMVDELYTALHAEMLRLNPGRIVTVSTLQEIKDDTYQENAGLIKIFGVVIFLLLTVTALGIIGLTSFSVAERTRQIGTRRALGATRFAILRYFLVENALITGCGLLLGLALTYSLNFALAEAADAPRLGLPLVGVGMALLWLAGLAAALVPALRGSAVAPVVATRTV